LFFASPLKNKHKASELVALREKTKDSSVSFAIRVWSLSCVPLLMFLRSRMSAADGTPAAAAAARAFLGLSAASSPVLPLHAPRALPAAEVLGAAAPPVCHHCGGGETTESESERALVTFALAGIDLLHGDDAGHKSLSLSSSCSCSCSSSDVESELLEAERLEAEDKAKFEQLRGSRGDRDRRPLKDVFPTAVAAKNRSKNRYNNICATETTRVHVSTQLCTSDYINANYVWGQDGVPSPTGAPFISTQAPLPNTIADFWVMILEQRAPAIVMLTRLVENSKQKAHLYWPVELNRGRVFGPVRVTLLGHHEEGSVQVRKIRIELTGNPFSTASHEVHHVQYTEWPDFDAPSSTRDIRRVMTLTRQFCDAAADPGPVVVHCSAGIGRSGTFIAACLLDEELERGAAVCDLKPAETVSAMREQRAGCVQTTGQFLFLRRVLRDRASYWERVRAAGDDSLESSAATDVSSGESTVPSDLDLLPDDTDAFTHGREAPTRGRLAFSSEVSSSTRGSLSPVVDPGHEELRRATIDLPASGGVRAPSPSKPDTPSSTASAPPPQLRLAFNYSLGLDRPLSVGPGGHAPVNDQILDRSGAFDFEMDLGDDVVLCPSDAEENCHLSAASAASTTPPPFDAFGVVSA
jgi:protein tyrosine phosphatase